jgi:hypothetical protein
MHKGHHTKETGGGGEEFEPQRPLRAVIIYNEVTDGKRAMHLLGNLAKGLGEDTEFQPLPWSFRLLADADWSDVAANDAVKADLLIIASNGPEPLPPSVVRWVESVISRKHGTNAAVISLTDSAESPSQRNSFSLKAIQTAAHQAGLDFFAPTLRRKFDKAIERIQHYADTVAPVLDIALSPALARVPQR